MLSVVAAPAKLTVVAVVLTRAKVVAPVSSPAIVAFPDTVSDAREPTLVRLDVTIVAGRVVPVRLPAGTEVIVAALLTHVKRLSMAAIAALSVVPQPVAPVSGSCVTPSIKYVVTVVSIQPCGYK
jgi:hypothetical protein